MPTESKNYSSQLKKPFWTHLALRVNSIDDSIAWYEKFTHLSLLTRGEDERGFNAWVGDATEPDSPFVLVMAQFLEGCDPFAPAAHPPIGPFAHIGIELPSKEMVDEVAELGRQNDCLAFGPKTMEKQIGYICFLKDPDGNTVEFSYDQGVYDKVKEVWGTSE